MNVSKVISTVRNYRQLTAGGDIPSGALRTVVSPGQIAEATKQGLILCIGSNRDIRYRLTRAGLDYSIYNTPAEK